MDYQATTPVAVEVLEKMLPYFRDNFGNPHSADHIYGWKSAEAVENAAEQIASMIGADKDEIIFTSGASESNNLALFGLARCALLKGGNKKRIIISAIEHKCVMDAARKLQSEYGFQVDIVGVDEDGLVCVNELESLIDTDVLLVSIMAVNNEVGTIQNIKKISELLKKSDILFHSDCAQAPLAMDMKNFGSETDLLSLSAHKIYGPKGIGALYIRRDLKKNIVPLINGGGQQYGLRSGTVPTPLCVGFGYACELVSNSEYQQKKIALQEKRDYFIHHLESIPLVKVSLNGPSGEQRHPGNVNVRFKGVNAHDILNLLLPKIAASSGSACNSGIQEPSYVMKALGLTTDEAESSVRFSLGFETSFDDLEFAVKNIKDILIKLVDVEQKSPKTFQY